MRPYVIKKLASQYSATDRNAIAKMPNSDKAIKFLSQIETMTRELAYFAVQTELEKDRIVAIHKNKLYI